MKIVLGMIGGLVASLAIFAVGLAVAAIVLLPEPERQPGPSVDVADLWTVEPRRIDKAAQDLERLAALPPPDDPKLTARAPSQATDTADAAANAAGPLDLVDTSSVGPVAGEDSAYLADELTFAHLEWCGNRYRSYRREDDSYMSYAGERLPCVSPYSKELTASMEASPAVLAAESYLVEGDPSSLSWLDASGGESAYAASSDHVSHCFSRYRSYRPEDNTYQPYGGGPRRQCR